MSFFFLLLNVIGTNERRVGDGARRRKEKPSITMFFMGANETQFSKMYRYLNSRMGEEAGEEGEGKKKKIMEKSNSRRVKLDSVLVLFFLL